MRSRKVSPGFGGDAHDEPVGEHARAAGHALRSPPLSRMTGALSPVIALSSTEATPSMTSPSPGIDVAGLDQHDVALAQRAAGDELVRRRIALGLARASWPATSLARLAQRVGLGLAAPLGHRLGEVGEQHREPQPQRHREDEPGGRLALADERLEEEHAS